MILLVQQSESLPFLSHFVVKTPVFQAFSSFWGGPSPPTQAGAKTVVGNHWCRMAGAGLAFDSYAPRRLPTDGNGLAPCGPWARVMQWSAANLNPS